MGITGAVAHAAELGVHERHLVELRVDDLADFAGAGVDGRHLRNDVDHTIEGAGTLVASSFIENQGLITANVNGKVLRLIVRTDNQPGTLPAYNSGVLKAENGGILSINPSIGGRLNNQGGTIMAASPQLANVFEMTTESS